MGLQFGKSVYISEVNGVRNIGRSNLRRRTQQELRSHAETVSLGDGWEEQCLQLKFFQTSEIVRNESSQKAHIWDAYVNIDNYTI